MNLKSLFDECGIKPVFEYDTGIEIRDIECDSRKIEKDYLFIAIEGYTVDGHNYIKNAFDKGAVACIINENKYEEIINILGDSYSNRLIAVKDTNKILPSVSKNFYGNPDEKMIIIGITGTKGKTTTTYIIKSIIECIGKKTGIIGTISHLIGNDKIKSVNTTPDAFELYRLLHKMYINNVEYVIMEISSHALELGRVEGLYIDVAIFSNFSQDHLDFHNTMEEYFNAKLKIFDLLEKSKKNNKIAIINKDINEYKRISEHIKDNTSYNKVSYGINNTSADIYAYDLNNINNNFTEYNVNVFDNDLRIKSNLIGNFNIYNTLCGIAVANHLQIDKECIKKACIDIQVAGRFEKITLSGNSIAVIDYAHTDNALDNVLRTIKDMKPDRIITVFGCGGDRDRSKRPLMGSVVAEYSDIIIVTSDNPRSEIPSLIINDIIPGIEKHNKVYHRIEDRKEAIEYALSIIQNNDIVLIAGKGHEDYQILKDKTIHFSDKEVVLDYITKNR